MVKTKLTWDDVPGALNYRLHLQRTDGGEPIDTILTPLDRPYEMLQSGFPPGVSFDVSVCGIDENGIDGFSASAVIPMPLPQPTNLRLE